MFFVSDNQPDRHKFIRSYLNSKQATIAVILAAIDFEWTIRRAILALGTRPTKIIREEVLANLGGGYEGYKKAWRKEVQPRIGKTLSEVIPHWSRLADSRRGAMRLRGQIVHGADVTVTVQYAKQPVEDWLAASRLLEELAKEHGGSLYRRLVRRRTMSDKPGKSVEMRGEG